MVEAKPATLGEWEAETGKRWNEADTVATGSVSKKRSPQVGHVRRPDGYFTKDIDLSDVMSDFVGKNEVDFVGVEVLDEEKQMEGGE